MSRRISVAPVTRVEGHLSLKLDVTDSGRVAAAYASGTMFRGFESIMQDRDPRDAIHLSQRVCGVCPIPHARTAVEAVERAFGVEVSRNAVLLRNLVQGAGLVSDHILHFYQLALLDYVSGPAFPPFTPALATDLRFSAAETDELVKHYLAALDARRQAQEMAALFAGKLPHVMTFAPGGVTQAPTGDGVKKFRDDLTALIAFVENVYVPDAMKLARTYPEYLAIGAGPRNLLSFGAFPDSSGKLLFPAGKHIVGSRHGPHGGGWGDAGCHQGGLVPLSPRDIMAIQESVKHAYYGPDQTSPSPDKGGAYSWVKAPRLDGEAYQVGALARMAISRDYHGGVSVMDRLLAGAHETAKVASAMLGWLDELALDASGYRHVATMPRAGQALALTEAPRGALLHWLEYADGKVTRYRIITPTAWNASPRDDREVPGAMEQALTGLRIADPSQPIEVYRVVHSFDPCMGCAVHTTIL